MDTPSSPTSDSSDGVPDRFRVDFVGRTLLGAYRVDRRLAEGGMGAVYLAEDVRLGMRVVVKVPHARFLGEPGFRGRFRREVAELVRLEHPRIVRILARGEEDEVPFFVLQYLGGGSLEDWLKDGVQSPAQAVAWLEPIASTLDFVHARGVVHRDVKPGNVLFDEAGHVFLSDFGVVKALDRGEDGSVTDVGTAVGSPVYMAPEQAVAREVGPAADQYALASMLFEALSGEPPFGRGAPIEIVIRKQQAAAPSIGDLRPEVPPAADAALRRALSIDPAERFPTCGAFAAAFAGAVAPAPAVAAASGRPARLWPLALVGALLAAGIVGAATDWFGLASRPRPSTSSRVTLLEPGAEPRRAYRFRLGAGSEDRTTLLTEERTEREFGGMPAVSTGSRREQVFSVRVDEVDAEGAARLTWRVEPVRAEPLPGTSPELLAMETKARDLDVVLDLTSRLLPTGDAVDVALGLRPGPDRDRAEQAGVDEYVHELAVELPSEPIGVGARWETTRSSRHLGMRFHGVVTHELLAVEGDRLRLRFQMAQVTADEKIGLSMGPGVETAIDSFQASGRGEVTVDLSRPLPVEHTVKGSVAFSGVIRRESKQAPIAVRIDFDRRLVRE